MCMFCLVFACCSLLGVCFLIECGQCVESDTNRLCARSICLCRLDTVIDHKILVMDAGSVVEFGMAPELLKNKGIELLRV